MSYRGCCFHKWLREAVKGGHWRAVRASLAVDFQAFTCCQKHRLPHETCAFPVQPKMDTQGQGWHAPCGPGKVVRKQAGERRTLWGVLHVINWNWQSAPLCPRGNLSLPNPDRQFSTFLRWPSEHIADRAFATGMTQGQLWGRRRAPGWISGLAKFSCNSSEVLNCWSNCYDLVHLPSMNVLEPREKGESSSSNYSIHIHMFPEFINGSFKIHSGYVHPCK